MLVIMEVDCILKDTERGRGMTDRKRLFSRIVSVVLVLATVCSSLFLSSFSPRFRAQTEPVRKGIEGVGGEFTDNAAVARRLDVVFSEFPVGSYFSYTGEPCTCHNKCSFYGGCDCISDYNDPEKNGALVRLFSCQCMGFAHYMFYKIFGFIDRTEYPENKDKYYSLGSLDPSQMTVENVKNLFKDAKTGANVRIPGGKQHSFIVLSTDEKGMYIYHANTGVPCRVDCWYWTWERFVEIYRNYGIQYVHMPTEYPESVGVYIPPPNSEKLSVPLHQLGQIRVYTPSSSLNLRAEADTNAKSLDLIPHGTLLNVTEISGEWGKVEYKEQTGWVFLAYTKQVLSVTVPADRFYSYEGIAADLSSVQVALLQEDMTLTPLEKTAYQITYSAPEEGKYTATVTAEGQSISFPMVILPKGDMNADHAVNATDAGILIRGIGTENSLSDRQKEGADLDGNGTVDRGDVQKMLSYFTGGIENLIPEPTPDPEPSTDSDSTPDSNSTADTSQTTDSEDKEGSS